jgi:Na+-driven multidrug efflux pump
MEKRKGFLKEAMMIAVPVALQAMLQSSFSMIDQLMVGQLGKTAIAAVEVGGKPQFVFAFVSGAIATVTGIMVSQYMGKNNQKKINTSMSVNLLVMLVLAAFTMGLCLLLPGELAGCGGENVSSYTEVEEESLESFDETDDESVFEDNDGIKMSNGGALYVGYNHIYNLGNENGHMVITMYDENAE